MKILFVYILRVYYLIYNKKILCNLFCKKNIYIYINYKILIFKYILNYKYYLN